MADEPDKGIGEPMLTPEQGEQLREMLTEIDPVVGHKTLRDGSHLPLHKNEADALWAAAEAAKAKREAEMPDENAALKVMGQAYQRLRELGWREAMYSPKDGSGFFVIEAGSTGIHRAHYSGEWPNGYWWIEEDGDLWPSSPILFKLFPEDQAKADAKMAEAMSRFASPATPQGER